MTIRQISGQRFGLPCRIASTGRRAYIYRVGQPTMAIHGLWNKRCGPGGSTRRLHQFLAGPTAGDPRGRTRLDARGKGKIRRPVWYHRYRVII